MTATPDAHGAAEANPFIGLRPFGIDDADRFFGRNVQTYELLRRLETLHFIAVLGPSGSGKSSLVRAGVLAALRDGYLADEGVWTIVVLEPGLDPVRAWTRALSPHLAPDYTPEDLLERPVDVLDTSKGPMVILVDQFEDVFKAANGPAGAGAATRFIDVMLATGRLDAKIFLILTMRSEFLPHCAQHPELAGAINEGVYLVPRMDRRQLTQAIVGQVRSGGGTITTELVDRLIDDVSQEEDSLPVLQHALTELWPKRNRWEPMGIDLYPGEGGLAAFIDRHAEAVFTRLPMPGAQTAAEMLFRTITDLTPEGKYVRRPIGLDAIVAETKQPADAVRQAIEAFTREGFLKPGANGAIDISHEAIARQWRRLGPGYFARPGDPGSWRDGWITLEARTRRAVRTLAEAAREWEKTDKDKAYVFRGTRLDRLLGELGERAARVPGLERNFLDASRRANRWDRVFSRQTFAVTLLIVVIGAAVGWQQVRAARLRESEAALKESTLALEAGKQALQTIAIESAQASDAEGEKRKAETVYLQAKGVDAPPDPVSPAPGAVLKARLYTQVWTREQEQRIRPVLAKLPTDDLTAICCERVSVGPRGDELRYFRPADADGAKLIAKQLDENGLSVRVSLVAGFEQSKRIRERHYELWLAQDENRPQRDRR